MFSSWELFERVVYCNRYSFIRSTQRKLKYFDNLKRRIVYTTGWFTRGFVLIFLAFLLMDMVALITRCNTED